MSDLNSTMSGSFTGTNMDDMADPGNSAPTGISKLKTKLKNAFESDSNSSGSKAATSGAPAPSPSIYSGIQSTMNGSK